MSHPIFWESKWFFYPIGNTTPVCLTEYLPPEQDGDILLLGCGDARNVLYTIYASGHDIHKGRKLDFTCCDWEPAILARNVLLYTLLVDHDIETIFDRLWNIYYHFMVDDASLALLISHCTKLAELSTDIDNWNTSPYAGVIRVCDRNTLSELHRLWSLYIDLPQSSAARRKMFKRDFQDEMRKIAARTGRGVTTAVRNAGPLSTYAWNVRDLHDRFWKTGTLITNAGATVVNPTFAFTSRQEGFVAHYGTCPTTAFPLAPAYADSSNPSATSLDNVVTSMRSQFRAWCGVFRTTIKENRAVVIRVVVGDILTTCRALRSLSNTSEIGPSVDIPVKAWNASPLLFDGGDYARQATGVGAPLLFDVIDTSNLSDHTGMLNVLIATVPLLKRTPFSTINTETLLASGKDPTRSFAERLCGDITTMSALLGILPINFVSGFATHSNVHELMNRAISASSDSSGLKARQFHEQLVWKLSSLCRDGIQHIALDSIPLARFLFSVYLKMFSYEDTMAMFRNGGDPRDVLEKSAVHYSRESFALFIRYLKDRVDTDWARAISALLSLISSDRQLMMGLNHYQDLLCHLHLLGIHSAEVFNPNDYALLENCRAGRLRGWSIIPSTIYIVLQIPHSKLDCLDDPDMPQTPILNAELVSMSANFHNAFTSLYVAFGTAVLSGSGEHGQVHFTEDPRGKKGTSSVVVAFCVPTWLLAVAPESTLVTLGIKSTPIHSMFSQKLGLTMRLHSAPLMDTESVFVVRSLPAIRSAPNIPSTIPVPSAVENKNTNVSTSTGSPSALYDDSCHVLQTLTAHEDLEGDSRRALAEPSTKVESIPKGPCEVDIHIGATIIKHLIYPYPVDSSKAKLRVARKSGWVEVVAPLCGAAALHPNKFLVSSDVTSLAPWNIHRVYPDRMPIVDINNAKDIQWVVVHTTLMLSDKERALVEAKSKNIPAIVNIKHSILSIFHSITKPARVTGSRIFGLHKVSGGGLGTIIFVDNLRLDLASHTIVADGYVLPLYDSFVSVFINKLGELEKAEGITHVTCQDDELDEWARLIPAFAERCRDWSHKLDCAYTRSGVIPLATGFGEVPICDCGRGKVSSSFTKHKTWGPFAPYVTRIAISPLFAVSYLDTVAGKFNSMFADMKLDAEATSSGIVQKAHTETVRCAYCKLIVSGDDPILRCSRCKQAVYCDRTCQTDDWPKHKKICSK